MNTMVHNTQWVTGHFHLIFGGTTVIMYFAIGYYLWPKMTGRQLYSNALALKQLWLWFIGMLVLTIPWHQLGLAGQPRRISSTPYDEALVQSWLPAEGTMIGMLINPTIHAPIVRLVRCRIHACMPADVSISICNCRVKLALSQAGLPFPLCECRVHWVQSNFSTNLNTWASAGSRSV